MKKLRRKTVGLIGFWGLCATVGVAACGNSFDSDDCKANRTCPPAEAGAGNSASGDAGMPSDGGADSTPGGTAGTGAENPAGLGGAGAGGEGGAVAMNPAPRVLSVTPTDAQLDVETDAVVTVTFSEPLAETTVKKSIKLTRGGKEVSGAVTYADSVATFKPARPLALLGDYELTVTTDVTDTEGAALVAPFKSKFVVRDGQFNVITAVEEDAHYLADAVPVESDGSVLLVWTDRGDSDLCPVLYQRFLRGVGIGTAESLSAEGATSCLQPTATASQSGFSAVGWAQFSDDRPVNIVQFRDGKWSRTDVSAGTTYTAGYVKLGFAIDGSLSAFDSNGGDVYSYRTDSRGAWVPKFETVANATYVNTKGTVAFDEEGNGISLWSGQLTDFNEIFVSRLTTGADKWSRAATLPGSKAPNDESASFPRAPALAVAPGGDAVAVWAMGERAKWQLMASRFDPSSGWAKAAPIGADWSGGAVDNRPPALVFDGETFVAAFTASQGTKLQTWVTRLDAATGEWSTPEKRQAPQDSASDETQPHLATDGHGNLILAWFAGTKSSFKPYFQRYTNETWSPTKPISPTPTSRTFDATLSSNEDGLAALTWTDVDGASGYKIYLASFY